MTFGGYVVRQDDPAGAFGQGFSIIPNSGLVQVVNLYILLSVINIVVPLGPLSFR